MKSKSIFVAMLLLIAASICWADGKGYFLAGQRSFNNSEFNKAIIYFTQAIDSQELSGKNLSAAYGWRGIAWSFKENFDKAIEDISQGITVNPDDPALWYSRAAVWKKKREYNKAIEDYSKVIAMDSQKYGAYFYRGQCWQEKGNMDRAIEDYSAAIGINPDNSSAYYYRSQALETKGRFEEALADARKALSMKPENKEFRQRVSNFEGKK